MRPTEHLLDTRMFRLVIIGPIAVAFFLTIIALSGADVTTDWSFDGFNEFVDLFKLPIGVAGLSIPLGALVASHHRSVQSASQITAQESQNIFSNFLKHKEYFGKYLDEEKILSGDFSFRAKDKKLYQALFPLAQKGNREFILAEDRQMRLTIALNELSAEVGALRWDERSKLDAAWQALNTLKRVIAEEFLLQISDYVNQKDIETLLNQVQNVQVTLDQIHSAASLFEQTQDTFQLYHWMRQAAVDKDRLASIKNFDDASIRVRDLCSTIKQASGQRLTEEQIRSVYRLLGKEHEIKLAFIRKDLSQMHSINLVIDQILDKKT